MLAGTIENSRKFLPSYVGRVIKKLNAGTAGTIPFDGDIMEIRKVENRSQC